MPPSLSELHGLLLALCDFAERKHAAGNAKVDAVLNQIGQHSKSPNKHLNKAFLDNFCTVVDQLSLKPQAQHIRKRIAQLKLK
jgi:hypothetical protein